MGAVPPDQTDVSPGSAGEAARPTQMCFFATGIPTIRKLFV